VAAAAVVVQAAAAARPGQRRVDGDGRGRAGQGRQREDLGVAAGRGEQLQPPVTQERDAGLAVLDPGQVDPEAERGRR
jgi:hypothetical protein